MIQPNITIFPKVDYTTLGNQRMLNQQQQSRSTMRSLVFFTGGVHFRFV